MTSRPTPTGVLVLPSSAPREEWLDARRGGITATDVARIVGVSPYGNAIDVWVDKRTPVTDVPPGEAARWGQLLEDEVAREWARRAGTTVRRVGLLSHRDHRHHLASLDRIARPGEPLEVKTRSAFVGWDDGIPERVQVQVQWQLHVSGCTRAHVAALVGGQRLETFTLTRDDTLVEYLVDEADRVWADVQSGALPHVAPHHLTAASLNRAYPDRSGDVDVDPMTAAGVLARYRDAAAAEKTATADKAAAAAELIRLLGDGDTATLLGAEAWTYRAHETTKLRAEALKAIRADHPDLLDQLTPWLTTTTTRTLRLKGTTT